MTQSLLHSYKRYRTLRTHTVSALPIVILMPHSACNCRCVMCDIWKGNKNLKQLTEKDIENLLGSLKQLGTRQVVMSGGEALLNPNFFLMCQMLKKQGLHITLLSTGLAVARNVEEILRWTDELIVSLDGDEPTHDAIRNVGGAYSKLRDGVRLLKSRNPDFRVSARTVIHRLNFRKWPEIIDSAREIGVDQISFLPADVTSHAFNRDVLWTEERQLDVALHVDELADLAAVLDRIIRLHGRDISSGFIAEPVPKLNKILQYYSALHQLCAFPYKKCNAPWVSTVVEADGTVKPCFFHAAIGTIRTDSLTGILNSPRALEFRRSLDTDTNETCKRCVCYLHLPPSTNPVK